MKIIVFSKKDCGKCSKAKEKITDFFKLKYVEVDADVVSTPMGVQAYFKDNRANMVDFQSAQCFYDDTLPLISIDGLYYDYSGAMKRLKELQGETK